MNKAFAIFSCLLLSSLVFSQGAKRMVTNYSGVIKEFASANSPQGDFSLVVNHGKAYFASSREASLIHYGENNWSKSMKIKVFQADIEKTDDFYEMSVNNINPLFEIKDEFTHVGPVSFSVTGDTLFFTKVPTQQVDKTLKVFKPQLYMLVKNGSKWSKIPQVLPFNNPLFSFAHPTFHSATKTLYFVSDMKGGQGGKDIYKATIENGKWANPVNVKNINSKQDEVFPFIAHDQTIFFSSNRSESAGGLDVFFCEELSTDVRALTFVNSTADDFGVFMFADKDIGFISSNRNGNDDLFTFTVSKERNLKNNLFGKFKYRKLSEAIEMPLAVYLLNEMRQTVKETFVNEDGEFEFFDVGLSQNYIVKAESKAEMDLVLFDGGGNADKRYLANEAGEFVYSIVDIKDVGELNLTQVNEKGETLIAGRFLFEDKPWEEPGTLKVNLIDENGKIAHSVNSDVKGYFDFRNLPNHQDYIVRLDKENTDLTLVIFNQDGKIIERLKDDGSGFYLYRQLKVLEITGLKQKNFLHEEPFSFHSDIISGDFDRNGEDVEFKEQLKVSVYDEKGELVETLLPNKNGAFEYNRLSGIENYDFKLDKMGKGFNQEGITLKILDEDGTLLTELIPKTDGAFQYKLMEMLNIKGLKQMSSVDEGDFSLLEEDIVSYFTGQVKYKSQSLGINEGIELSVYDNNNNLQNKLRTNSKGEFEFEHSAGVDEYSIKISEKPDSMSIDLFLIEVEAQKNSAKQIILPLPSGDFKYKRMAPLSTQEPLSLTELEESLDLIFEISGNYDYDNNEGSFDEPLKISAYDGNGELIGEVLSDRLGQFTFKQLPGISTVLFKLEDMPTDFDLEKFSLFIEGDEGKQLAKLRSSEKGFFVYKPLGFASELPFELTEQMDDSKEHAIFGTNALDLSNAIESVYYGSNKTNPNSSDVLKIEKMLLLLEINPTSQLEINAYADSRASDNYNLILSERRADWIKSYLIRKGVDGERMVINAYGEGKLVNDCQDGVDCPDKDHALNRRAELRIIN